MPSLFTCVSVCGCVCVCVSVCVCVCVWGGEGGASTCSVRDPVFHCKVILRNTLNTPFRPDHLCL